MKTIIVYIAVFCIMLQPSLGLGQPKKQLLKSCYVISLSLQQHTVKQIKKRLKKHFGSSLNVEMVVSSDRLLIFGPKEEVMKIDTYLEVLLTNNRLRKKK